ncbi:MAG: septum formation initiator family protein [Roseburia sp.]
MAATKRRRKNSMRAGKLCISMILVAFVAVMSVQIVRVYQKDQQYARKQEELELLLKEETARQQDLEEYEAYTKSQQYVEDIAKSKLGLAYDNEIIFKEEK